MSVDRDQVREAQLTREAVRAAEGLGRKRRQVIDVLRLTFAEERFEQRIGKHSAVEDILEAMNRLLATSMVIKRGHRLRLAGGDASVGWWTVKISEEAVFRWVLIVGVAAASVVALTLLTRPLVGALWGLVLVIAGCVHGYRWVRDWRKRSS
jgi:hypothetical protein